MGQKLDFLLGKNFKTSKLKNFAKLAISRTNILKNQHFARCSYARSDVAELLKLGRQGQALLRVELVIKEQKMLDVLDMVETYCHVLEQKAVLFRKNKECPEELKEAVSSLIFASSRCSDLPEIMHIREILTSRFGQHLATEAIELRNDCSVNPKMTQKLATRKISSDSKLKVLKEIASESHITLQLEDDISQEKIGSNQELKPKQKDSSDLSDKLDLEQKFPEPIEENQYSKVDDAVNKAFESDSSAAKAAAKAATELSNAEA